MVATRSHSHNRAASPHNRTRRQGAEHSHVEGHYVNEDVENVLGGGQDNVILQCARTPTLSVHAQRPETRLTGRTKETIHKAGANCPV